MQRNNACLDIEICILFTVLFKNMHNVCTKTQADCLSRPDQRKCSTLPFSLIQNILVDSCIDFGLDKT